MKPAFGFQHGTFELLAKKGEEMTEAQRHGSLLLDEMKVEEGLDWDKWSLKVEGFMTQIVTMDKDTPKEDENKCLNEGWQDLHQAFRCPGVTLKIP
ncbi:DNA transposase [Frankliniella fusca]|uniref:DNA transposase n=1 Tax=Frankliniella fusca TaxID=407009 RepID=A0AAE1L7G2_9NEOP|nr:DNA transposase [Frankliniella fusca]